MTPSHEQIVVGFDFTTSATAALERALALATAAPHHVLHFVCAIDPHRCVEAIPTSERIDYRYAERVERELVDEVANRLRAAEAPHVDFYVHARIGKPAEQILAVASEVGADLIIVGSKGAVGLTRLVIGSVSEHVVRAAGCAVEVARPKTYLRVERLVVVEVEPTHTYVPPHRYLYDDHRLTARPVDWPLY